MTIDASALKRMHVKRMHVVAAKPNHGGTSYLVYRTAELARIGCTVLYINNELCSELLMSKLWSHGLTKSQMNNITCIRPRDTDALFAEIDSSNYDLVIIDGIHTLITGTLSNLYNKIESFLLKLQSKCNSIVLTQLNRSSSDNDPLNCTVSYSYSYGDICDTLSVLCRDDVILTETILKNRYDISGSTVNMFYIETEDGAPHFELFGETMSPDEDFIYAEA